MKLKIICNYKAPNLGDTPKTDGTPNPGKINGPIHIVCMVIRNVMSSAAEAEMGTLFINARKAVYICQILEELGQRQPSTPI